MAMIADPVICHKTAKNLKPQLSSKKRDQRIRQILKNFSLYSCANKDRKIAVLLIQARLSGLKLMNPPGMETYRKRIRFITAVRVRGTAAHGPRDSRKRVSDGGTFDAA